MNPTITAARKCCEAMGACQVIVVAFDALGQWAVVSYGTTKAECAAVAPVCDDIANALRSGKLAGPR